MDSPDSPPAKEFVTTRNQPVKHRPGEPPEPLVATSSIPVGLAERLRRSVRRPWLKNKIEESLPSIPPGMAQTQRSVLVVGEPGSGKTILLGQLAEAWRCPSYFIRTESAGGVIWKDPKNFFISIGLQLRAQFGPEIFGPPSLEVRGTVEADHVSASGRVRGVEVGILSLSPFRQVLIDVQVKVEEVAGEASLIRIGELHDAVVDMTAAQLAREAIVEPLGRLASLRPNERVRIVLDSLDDSPEMVNSIPIGDESPPNVDWVLSSQPGDHLARLFALQGGSKVVLLDLGTPENLDSSIEDVETYVNGQLNEPEFSSAFEQSELANRPIGDFAHDLAQASKGNFLYLHHLIEAIHNDAKDSRFDLLARPTSALPQGLDGIYRYFLVDRILPNVGIRDWVDFYVPVLGVLAVARAPLTSVQLAAFSRQDELVVDRVTGSVRRFLEAAGNHQGQYYSIYHRSFADYLLAQDQSRNPYPLRPATFYHGLLVHHYDAFDESKWASSQDRYALIHLSTHLLQAGRLEELCKLLSGSFAGRQIALVGISQTRTDSIAAARAAAANGLDELFLEMLETSARLESGVDRDWNCGQFILSLLKGQADEIQERAGYRQEVAGIGLSDRNLPWSGFLVVERLIDLGALPEARDVIRQVLRKPWPGNKPRNFSNTGALENSSFDFVLEDAVIGFLSKSAQIDPSSALATTRRLFRDERKLPNAFSAWREVVKAFLSWRLDFGPHVGLEVTPEQCLSLATTTCDWLRSGGFVLGLAGVTLELFRLIARATSIADPLWISNALLLAVNCRLAAHNTVQGASEQSTNGKTDERPGLWSAWADILTGILDVADSLGSEQLKTAVPDKVSAAKAAGSTASSMSDILAQCVHTVLRTIPRIEKPITGGHGPRAEYLSHLVFALHRARSERWPEYAQAALTACELDLSMNDPPRISVSRGLTWLQKIRDVAPAAQKLISRFELAKNIETIAQEAANSGSSNGITVSLKQLGETSDTYERGRIALALWRRGDATLTEIRESLTKSFKINRQRQVDSREGANVTFPDLVAESLIEVLVGSPVSWAMSSVASLDESRTPRRRKNVRLDKLAYERARAQLLAKRGESHLFRVGAEKQYHEILRQSNLKKGDLTTLLGICMLMVRFDPDLADKWYIQILPRLRSPRDRGLAVVNMVRQLKDLQPTRLPDLGARWAGDLPVPDSVHAISIYELRLFENWGDSVLFKSQLIAHLLQVAEVLPAEVARISADVARLNQDRGETGRRAEADREEGPDEEDRWWLIGTVLGAASQIVINGDDELLRAAGQLVRACREALDQSLFGAPDWQKCSATRKILEQVVSDEDRTFQRGPIAETLLKLYTSIVHEGAKRIEESLGKYDMQRRDDILLGLSLAGRLKKVEGEWAVARFDEAIEMWNALVAGEPTHSGGLEGMAETIVDTFASAILASGEHRFRSNRERVLFDLTKKLARWCLAQPPSTGRLIPLQYRISKLGDPDLRNLLLAPLAAAWLESGDFGRASTIVQLAGPDFLSEAQVDKTLKSIVKSACYSGDGSKLASFKSIVLDLILLTPPGKFDDVLCRLFGCWFCLRAREVSELDTNSEAAYLKRLVDWTLSTAKTNSDRSAVRT